MNQLGLFLKHALILWSSFMGLYVYFTSIQMPRWSHKHWFFLYPPDGRPNIHQRRNTTTRNWAGMTICLNSILPLIPTMTHPLYDNTEGVFSHVHAGTNNTECTIQIYCGFTLWIHTAICISCCSCLVVVEPLYWVCNHGQMPAISL